MTNLTLEKLNDHMWGDLLTEITIKHILKCLLR